MNRSKYIQYTNRALLLLVVAIMLLIRFLYLEADPLFMKRLGDIQDEGYWTHNARMKVLFDQWVPDDMSHAIVFSPLYTGLIYFSFKTLGISFFSARVISAIFSVLTILLLYILLRSTLRKEVAALASLLLGLNYTYLIYNRLALVETTLSFFLLLSLACWYYSYQRPWWSVLSGLAFSLAILIKITAIYFAPIFILLWIADYYRKSFRLFSFFSFSLATALPLGAYAYFIFIPNLPLYKINLINSLAFSHKSIWDIAASFFRIFTNNFFGEISVFLLFILFILSGLYAFYIFSTSKSAAKKTGDNPTEPSRSPGLTSPLQQTPPMILIALCWILGGLLGMVFSNMHDRRFLMFLIPLSIIASYTFVSWKKEERISSAGLSERIYPLLLNRGSLRAAFLISITYPLFSLLYVFVNIHSHLNFTNDDLNKYFVMAFLGTNLLLSILSPVVLKKWPVQFKKGLRYLLPLNIIMLLLLPLFSVIKNYLRTLLLMIGLEKYETKMIVILFILIGALMISGSFRSAWKRQDLVLTRAAGKRCLNWYLVMNIFFIGISFLFLSFTVTETSKALAQHVEKGAIIAGPSPNLLSLETEARPVFYSPDDPHYAPLNNATKPSHQYLLVSPWYEGQRVPDEKLLIHKYQRVTLIEEFPLYLYPNGKPKQIVRLYKVGEP